MIASALQTSRDASRNDDIQGSANQDCSDIAVNKIKTEIL